MQLKERNIFKVIDQHILYCTCDFLRRVSQGKTFGTVTKVELFETEHISHFLEGQQIFKSIKTTKNFYKNGGKISVPDPRIRN